MSFSDEDIELIERKVQDIEQEYQATQGLILSEHDLECLIYHKLFEDVAGSELTLDPHIRGVSLHCRDQLV